MSATEIAVQGLKLQVGNGASPETFTTVANVESYTRAGQSRVVDTSNVTDAWQRVLPTLLEAGKVSLTIFWVMEDPSHDSQAFGLRGLWQNKTKADWKLVFPDGNNSTDAFTAYVTKFSDSGKVADVFKASIDLSQTGQPSLV